MFSTGVLRGILYPIIFSERPADRVAFVVKLTLAQSERRSPKEHQDRIIQLVATIRAELATPTQRVRDICELKASETQVSEADVRDYLRLVAEGIEAALEAAPRS